MKFYDEEQMRYIRRELEGEVLRWPGVATRQMMGCLCYFYGKKFFAFLVTGGIVITKLSEDDRVKLSKAGGEPFEMAGKKVSTWIKTKLKEPNDVKKIMPLVKKSYQSASGIRK
ncbi:MAG: TfoX/Sxy family protein [Thaumarchaeota archaeon]|nr:TfoX/Sxy family protein [Nitrososphaerota archaeon]